MDIKLSLMAGIDIPIPELQVTLHQPTIKDIAYMGEDNFFSALQYLCLNKDTLIQDKSLSENLTNFQVLMKVLMQQEMQNQKIAITTLLSLLFPQYSPLLTPNSILLNNFETKDTKIIDNNNFDMFQEILKQVLCLSSIFQGENIVYNPANEAAKKIADKIMAGRQKIAAQKANNKESVLTRYLSILTIGLNSMSLENCLNLTIFQMFDLVERYSLYINWDINLRVRLAGGDPKDEENWMKNIH